VACGAFPFAFRAQGIERSKSIDVDDFNEESLSWSGEPTTFIYSDGGILQNQPLGMAKNLVDPIDLHRQEKRFYLFVSPHAKDPTPTDFSTDDADFVPVLKRLVGAATGQAGFQDWITARGINKRVQLLDARAAALKDAIARGKIDVKSLQTTAAAILALFFVDGKHLPPGATKEETLEEAQERTATQYAQEMIALNAVPGGPTAFRNSVLAFETAAELGARDFMTIYGVTAKESELAGAAMQSFLKFFDQNFRDHDYDIARVHAQQFLKNPVLNENGQLGPLRFQLSAVREINSELDGLQLGGLPAKDVDLFKTGMKRRVDQLIEARYPRWQFTHIIADLIVDWLIDLETSPPEIDPVNPLGLK
jgi:hypothetical protein